MNRAQQHVDTLEASGTIASSRVNRLQLAASGSGDSSSTVVGDAATVACPVPEVATAVPQPYKSTSSKQVVAHLPASQEQRQQPVAESVACRDKRESGQPGSQLGQGQHGVVRFARFL